MRLRVGDLEERGLSELPKWDKSCPGALGVIGPLTRTPRVKKEGRKEEEKETAIMRQWSRSTIQM